jgi:cation diffusion facilitator family transporter
MKSYERFRLNIALDDDTHGPSVVAVAFVANVLVAIAKTAAAVLTGSSSMRTEAVHSWVDVGNEGFVVAATRSARRPADFTHAMGHGRASYVWSLFASLGTLAAGALVGVWEGVRQLGEPDVPRHYVIGYVVLGLSFVLEGTSFLQTLRQVRKQADELGRDLFEHALATSDSPTRAVFAEDFTALIALAAAAFGMLLHQLTGRAVFDAAGSIAIGVLMGVTALFLISRNARFLGGESLAPKQWRQLLAIIRADPRVERVTFVYTEFIGPGRCLVIAGMGISGERSQSELAAILRDIERGLMRRPHIGLAIMTLATAEDRDL